MLTLLLWPSINATTERDRVSTLILRLSHINAILALYKLLRPNVNAKLTLKWTGVQCYSTRITFHATSGNEQASTELLAWDRAKCLIVLSGQENNFGKLICLSLCVTTFIHGFFSCKKCRHSTFSVQKGRRQTTSVHCDCKPSINHWFVKLLEHQVLNFSCVSLIIKLLILHLFVLHARCMHVAQMVATL